MRTCAEAVVGPFPLPEEVEQRSGFCDLALFCIKRVIPLGAGMP